MDSRQIELRLRVAAPEEPALLPPLVLPTFEALRQVEPTIRFRGSAAGPRRARLVYALVALVLLMVSVIVAGALRLMDNQLDQPGRICSDARVFDEMCFSMAWPEGWHVLLPADWNGNNPVGELKFVVASAAIPCGAVPNPVPTAYPSGAPEADPVVAISPEPGCLRTGRLPDGAIRVTAEVTERGPGDSGAVAGTDTTEPTPEEGWTERIDDRPARLRVSINETASAAALEIWTWDILLPGAIDRVLRVTGEIADPDLESARTTVQSIARSIDFEKAVVPLDPGTAAAAIRLAIDAQDRNARSQYSDFFGCFPREPGTSVGTISAGLTLRLPAPVQVTCSTAVEASAAGLWRLTLEMRWPDGDGYPAGGRIQELFVTSTGATAGDYWWALGHEPLPGGDEAAVLPMPPLELPPPLSGPLAIPIGSIVEMLAPGQFPHEGEPSPADTSLAPGLVGQRFHVLDGPRIDGGDEWYQVQWSEGMYTRVAWARGTLDGRPMLAVVTPSCPSAPVDLALLMLLTPAERVACFGSGDIPLEPVTVIAAPPADPQFCATGENVEPTTCPPAVGTPAWLTEDARLLMFGSGGAAGPVPGLEIWRDPSTAAIPTDEWLIVHGHFDDPAAATCSWLDNGAPFVAGHPAALQVLICRERFVVTGFETVAAP